MTAVSPMAPQKLSTSTVSSSVKKSRSWKKPCIFTDSSSDSDTPSLDVLKSPNFKNRLIGVSGT